MVTNRQEAIDAANAQLDGYVERIQSFVTDWDRARALPVGAEFSIVHNGVTHLAIVASHEPVDKGVRIGLTYRGLSWPSSYPTAE